MLSEVYRYFLSLIMMLAAIVPSPRKLFALIPTVVPSLINDRVRD